MSWRIVPLLMLVVALAHFNRLSISVAGAEQIIRPDFISETQMGMVYSAFLVLYTIFMIPGGWFIDRFGPHAGWMVLGFGSAAGMALTGLVGLTFTQAGPLLLGLLVARSLTGIVSAPLHPSGARLVANWIPTQGVALANGLVTGAACVGMASTYVVFGMLIDGVGWPRAFLVTGAATFGVAVLWTVAGSNYPQGITAAVKAKPNPASFDKLPDSKAFPSINFKNIHTEPGRFTRLLMNPSLICLTLSYGAVGYFEYLFYYWAQYYFEKVQSLDKDTSRLYATLLQLAMGAGMVIGGWLADRAVGRFGLRRGLAVVPVVGLLLGAAATLAGLRVSRPEVILLSFAVAYAAVGSCEGSFWTAAVQIGGARGGTAAAILNTGGNAVGLLAPVVTPAIAARFGWHAGLVLASFVCVVGAVLWVWINPTDGGMDRPDAYQKKVGSFRGVDEDDFKIQ